MIPIYEEPYKDEHILGWFMRLADMNGMKMDKFLEYYMPYFKWEHSVDTIGNMIGMDYCNPLELMRNNTLYPALFPFLTEGTQAKIIWRFLYGGNIHWYHTVTDMCFCPKCLEEDIKMGRTPYYRVWHQLDEIYTCAEHKTTLWAVPKKNLGVLTDSNLLKSARQISRSEIDISSYICKIYQNPVRTSLEKWGYDSQDVSVSRGSRIEAIRAGERAGLKSVPGFRYLDMFQCEICGELYLAHPFSHRTTGMCQSCKKQYSEQELIDRKAGGKGIYTMEGRWIKHSCGRTLSGGYHDFMWSDKECPCLSLPTLEEYKKEFDDEEFTIEEFETIKGKTFFYVKHHVCGNIFKVGRTDFMNRRYCRYCSKTYEERFKKKFYAMVGNEYNLLKLPESTVDDFTAVHNICGTKFKMRARNFLEGQRCPFCQTNIGFEKTMELLRKNAELTGYEIKNMSPDMLVTLPEGKRKKIRFATAIQDLTRLDEPEIFVRKNRIEPFISDKAKVYLYIRENCDKEGIFVSDKDYMKLQITPGTFFSSIQYLKKSGVLAVLSKGVYQVKDRGKKNDYSNILSAL